MYKVIISIKDKDQEEFTFESKNEGMLKVLNNVNPFVDFELALAALDQDGVFGHCSCGDYGYIQQIPKGSK